jgi:hypothetical protein
MINWGRSEQKLNEALMILIKNEAASRSGLTTGEKTPVMQGNLGTFMQGREHGSIILGLRA